MAISEIIKARRKEKGLTQSQLAELVGVSTQAISKWETGAGMPDISQVIPLAKALRISTDELLDYHDRRAELEVLWHKTLRKYGDMSAELLEFVIGALREYPDDQTFLYRRVCNEYFLSRNTVDEDLKGRYLDQARGHALALVDKFPDFDSAISILVQILVEGGKREEALSYAYKSKDKDRLLKYCLTGDELRHHHQKLINLKLSELLHEMMWEDAASLDAVEAIIRAVIPDGNYFDYSHLLMMVNINRAKNHIKEKEYDDAMIDLRKAFEIAKNDGKYCAGDYMYTAPVLNKLICHRETSLQSRLEAFYENQVSFKAIQNRADYQKLIREMEIALVQQPRVFDKNVKMQLAEFESLIRQGRGLALLRLQNEADKSPFRNAVINAALHDLRYDKQTCEDQAWYVYQLIQAFEEGHGEANEIIAAINSHYREASSFGDDFSHYIKMLTIFAENGNKLSASAITHIYNNEFNTLLNRTIPPDDYDYECDRYGRSAVATVASGGLTVKELFSDIGRLLDKDNLFAMYDFDMWVDEIRNNIGYEAFAEAISGNDVNINKFKTSFYAEKQRTREIIAKRNLNMTAFEDTNKLIEHIRSGKEINFGMKRFLRKSLDNNQLLELSQLAYDETDMERKTVLYFILPMFIDPREEMLIEEARKYEYALKNPDSKEYRLECKILDHLGRTHSPKHMAYAAELLAKGYPDSLMVGLRAQVYGFSDRDSFFKCVKKIHESKNEEASHAADFAVLDLWEIRPQIAPVKLLYYVYETTFCAACRRRAVRIMCQNRLPTDIFRNEWFYDSEEEIRKLGECPESVFNKDIKKG